jgi:hypothetical protein
MTSKHPHQPDQDLLAWLRRLEDRVHALEQGQTSYIEVRIDDPDTDVIGPGFIWFRSDTNQLAIWTGSVIRRVTMT